MQCTSHAPLPVSQNGARTNTHLCLPTGLIVINCLRLKRECYFQGAFYSKAAWVTGSLLTWMTAQKTKHAEILHTASSWFPLSVFWLCWIQEKNRLPFYMVWVTMTVYLHVLFFWRRCRTVLRQNTHAPDEWSLTAAPWGPGGPGIPAWPGPPCINESRRRIN